MKKSLKKLALNKKAVSNLSGTIHGGLQRQEDTILPPDTTTSATIGTTGPTGPTDLTLCFDCPPKM